MKVCNIHECELAAESAEIGMLLDSLASRADRLWPKQAWPRMEFDRPLGVGAKGGHGPVRYFVEEYAPGESIQFQFTGPNGFAGYHRFDILQISGKPVVLRHTLAMNTSGQAILTWPLIFRPMHDALIEDSLAGAKVSLGLPAKIQPWSAWVKILRWLVSGGKAGSQMMPQYDVDSGVEPQSQPARKTAVLVIDVQQGLCEGAGKAHDCAGVIARINLVTGKARDASVPVIFIQHESTSGLLEHNTPGWQLAAGLEVAPGDMRIRKTTPDSFLRTRLDAILRDHHVESLVVCGMHTEFCVDTTTRRAMALGYPVTLIADAHTTAGNDVLTPQQVIQHHHATLTNIASFGPRVHIVF